MIARMLGCFNIIFAQSDEDGARLKALGAGNVMCVGNLKYDAALLPCIEAELVRLKNAIGTRPVWLAASTHPGEEAIVAAVHKILAADASEPAHHHRAAPSRARRRHRAGAQKLSRRSALETRTARRRYATLYRRYAGRIGTLLSPVRNRVHGRFAGKARRAESAGGGAAFLRHRHRAAYASFYRRLSGDASASRGALQTPRILPAKVASLLENPDTLEEMQTAGTSLGGRAGGRGAAIARYTLSPV